jgi:hypothetical protein
MYQRFASLILAWIHSPFIKGADFYEYSVRLLAEKAKERKYTLLPSLF